MINEVVAPLLFLMPISLVRLSAVKDANPNNPMHASNNAIMKANPIRLEGSLKLLYEGRSRNKVA
jgi:hypothetical protein